MKTLISLCIIGLLLSSNSVLISQNTKNTIIKQQIIPVLKGKYKYCTTSCDVIVEFKGNTYTEYYPDDEYIISSIKWISNKEYQLTIIKNEKKGLPLKIGTKMKTKIVKSKKGVYHYESEMKGLNWSGTFTKIN